MFQNLPTIIISLRCLQSVPVSKTRQSTLGRHLICRLQTRPRMVKVSLSPILKLLLMRTISEKVIRTTLEHELGWWPNEHGKPDNQEESRWADQVDYLPFNDFNTICQSHDFRWLYFCNWISYLILLIKFCFLNDFISQYVINYDYPNNSEDYIHRIGKIFNLKTKFVHRRWSNLDPTSYNFMRINKLFTHWVCLLCFIYILTSW